MVQVEAANPPLPNEVSPRGIQRWLGTVSDWPHRKARRIVVRAVSQTKRSNEVIFFLEAEHGPRVSLPVKCSRGVLSKI